MICSMTGYGSATGELDGGTVAVEIRSVNSRHLRVNIGLPTGLDEQEAALRALVSGSVERGSVDVRVRLDEGEDEAPELGLDHERVEAYLEAFETLRTTYALPGSVDLPLLVACGGLLKERRSEPAAWADPGAIEDVVDRALQQMLTMRREEGERLQADLRRRLDAIGESLETVEELAPERLARERERLLSSVREIVESVDGAFEDDRLAREIALTADKWDIGEELTRARAHLEAFDELLRAPDPEAVGKRLKFLLQELQREINTMGAKASDAGISRAVVEMKNEVEKLREQIENVE